MFNKLFMNDDSSKFRVDPKTGDVGIGLKDILELPNDGYIGIGHYVEILDGPEIGAKAVYTGVAFLRHHSSISLLESLESGSYEIISIRKAMEVMLVTILIPEKYEYIRDEEAENKVKEKFEILKGIFKLFFDRDMDDVMPTYNDGTTLEDVILYKTNIKRQIMPEEHVELSASMFDRFERLYTGISPSQDLYIRNDSFDESKLKAK